MCRNVTRIVYNARKNVNATACPNIPSLLRSAGYLMTSLFVMVFVMALLAEHWQTFWCHIYLFLENTFKRLVACFNLDYIPSVDVVVESLTREHYRQQFLLDLSIVLFGVCHGSGCVAYWLAILHERISQARPRRVCLNRYAFSLVVTQHRGVTDLHVYRTHGFCVRLIPRQLAVLACQFT